MLSNIYLIIRGIIICHGIDEHVFNWDFRTPLSASASLNPTEPRSATISSRSAVIALKVSEAAFHKAAHQHPQIWEVVAQVVTDRLPQRSSLNYPNSKPLLFLGCSAESLKIVQEIQLGLKHDDVEVVGWTDGVVGNSRETDRLMPS